MVAPHNEPSRIVSNAKSLIGESLEMWVHAIEPAS